ncbi:hypothetical protein BG004_001870, partial [Podila humilis]
TGYDTFIIARPILYSMLLRQIPLHKIHMGKKILSLEQDENGVTIYCSDNRAYHGDLLVGADGSSSIVRTSIYSQLKAKDLLSPEDEAEMRYTCEVLVGQTKTLSTQDFPEMKLDTCVLNTIVGCDGPYKVQYVVAATRTPVLWTTLTTGYSICFMVFHFFDNAQKGKSKSKDKDQRIQPSSYSSTSSSNVSTSSGSFHSNGAPRRHVEWGQEGTDIMCSNVRGFAVPGGNGKLTVGDLIDQTSKDFLAKGMLAERVYDTWFHGRVVLMGDACHPMDPYGGQGAVNAMTDALTLANWINILPSSSQKDIEAIFDEYKAERQPAAKKSFQATRIISLTNEKGFAGTVSRFAAKKTPVWLRRYMFRKMAANRPQASFLPYVADNGQLPAAEQPSYVKTKHLAEQKATRTKYS